MAEHTVKQFDADLEHIRTRVLQMGGMVEMQIFRAMEGFQSGDIPFLDKVIDDDHRVNLLEVELDEACTHIIAKRQPAASDLRMIMTVIKTITDLERIGDEGKKIAKMSRRLHTGDRIITREVELKHAANVAVEMLRKSLDAFARLDVNAAAQVVRQDSEVDTAFKSIMRQLITYMMEDPRTISSCLEMLFIAKAIERVGDHAMNIAEHVVFVARGEDVRFEKSQAQLGRG